MVVDWFILLSLLDVRDVLVNVVVDLLFVYGLIVLNLQYFVLMVFSFFKLFFFYVLVFFKQKVFRMGISIWLDDCVYVMCQIKFQLFVYLMRMIYFNLYRIDRLIDEGVIYVNDRVVLQLFF